MASREDKIILAFSAMTKKILHKDQECDDYNAWMMTQLDLITKHMIWPRPTSSHKNMNVVGVMANDGDDNFEMLYNGEIQYVGNKMVGSRLAFHRQVRI